MNRGALQLFLFLAVPLLSGMAAGGVERLSDQFGPRGLRHVIPPIMSLIGLLPAVAGPAWAAMLTRGPTAGRVAVAVTGIICGPILYFWGHLLGLAVAHLCLRH